MASAISNKISKYIDNIIMLNVVDKSFITNQDMGEKGDDLIVQKQGNPKGKRPNLHFLH
jgi:hypothetical protein